MTAFEALRNRLRPQRLRWWFPMLLLLLAGCAAGEGGVPALRGRVDVFGVQLGSGARIERLQGVAGTDEPCLREFERSFDPVEVRHRLRPGRQDQEDHHQEPGHRYLGDPPRDAGG